MRELVRCRAEGTVCGLGIEGTERDWLKEREGNRGQQKRRGMAKRMILEDWGEQREIELKERERRVENGEEGQEEK